MVLKGISTFKYTQFFYKQLLYKQQGFKKLQILKQSEGLKMRN